MGDHGLIALGAGLAVGWSLGRWLAGPASVADGLLTARQREVLRAVGDGHTSKEIAARMGLREATVRTHVRRARKKLGAPNRAAAIARFARVQDAAAGVPSRPRRSAT